MRIIDGKHAVVNETIVKHHDGTVIEEIPADEPLFLFRARDILSIDALRYYLEVCSQHKCTKYQLAAVSAMILKFKKWQDSNPVQLKSPGSSHGK